MLKIFLTGSLIAISFTGFSQAKSNPIKKTVTSKTTTAVKKPVTGPKTLTTANPTERLAEITTQQGAMVVKLYNETPLHRDNFVKLVKQGYYDSLLFHRIIESFMIQGGDPASKTAADGVPLGSGSLPGERIPAEFNNKFYHKKGALAAARDNNPQRASSNCQFYIVHGKKLEEPELQTNLSRVINANPTFNWTMGQREVYQRIGGAPFLDQSYTVFGEVVSGLEVIDKIARLPKAPGDRPLENVRMKIKMLN